jgi:hypothetical protein
VLGLLVQGSAGSSPPPACSSSMEIPSGVRIKAMRPSRGGRLIVTPRAMKALQVDCGPAVPGVPEGNRTGDNSETQMGPARSARAGIRRAPGLTFPFGRARLLGIRLVVFSGVFEPRDLVGEGILETYERILHAQRGLSLCKAHLMLGYPQRLKHSIFVVAGERERIWICHNRKNSQGGCGGKGENENLRRRSSPDALNIRRQCIQREQIGAFDPSLHVSVRRAGGCCINLMFPSCSNKPLAATPRYCGMQILFLAGICAEHLDRAIAGGRTDRGAAGSVAVAPVRTPLIRHT